MNNHNYNPPKYIPDYTKEKIIVVVFICILIILSCAIYFSVTVAYNYEKDDKGDYINDRTNYIGNLVAMILLWIIFIILIYILILYIFDIDRDRGGLFANIKKELMKSNRV